jgi:hypothetical protein
MNHAAEPLELELRLGAADFAERRASGRNARAGAGARWAADGSRAARRHRSPGVEAGGTGRTTCRAPASSSMSGCASASIRRGPEEREGPTVARSRTWAAGGSSSATVSSRSPRAARQRSSCSGRPRRPPRPADRPGGACPGSDPGHGPAGHGACADSVSAPFHFGAEPVRKTYSSLRPARPFETGWPLSGTSRDAACVLAI